MIIDGKEETELIAYYKDKKKEQEEKLIILNKNNEKGQKIRLRIINKMKDMNEIIKKNELDLTKWNINNVTDMSYLFSGCLSLSSLPDISKWNINNVINIIDLFDSCFSLPLPFFNFIKKTNLSSLFGLYK